MPRKARARSEDVTLDEPLTFADLQLPAPLVLGLRERGLVVPSPVQRLAIPLGRLGADLVVQAKSGTGKTAAFSAILLERVDRAVRRPQALVLAPTREVAAQTHAFLLALARSLGDPPLDAACCVGGEPLARDRDALARGCHVVVGAPGRVRQLLEEGTLRPESLRLLVVDEADALMQGSFEADVAFAFAITPERKQTVAVSATYPEKMRRRLEGMMREPIRRVNACTQQTTALRAVRQFYVRVGAEDDKAREEQQPALEEEEEDVEEEENDRRAAVKRDLVPGASRRSLDEEKTRALLETFRSVAFHQAVVFAKRPGFGAEVRDALRRAGYAAELTGGHLPQPKRAEAMRNMRAFRARVLVSTDLVARGVDLERVNLVAHLDVPRTAAAYAHRVGRAGRFGGVGISVLILRADELRAALRTAEEEGQRLALEPLPKDVPVDWYDFELDAEEERMKAEADERARREEARRRGREEEEEEGEEEEGVEGGSGGAGGRAEDAAADGFDGVVAGAREDLREWASWWWWWWRDRAEEGARGGGAVDRPSAARVAGSGEGDGREGGEARRARLRVSFLSKTNRLQRRLRSIFVRCPSR